ncbi:hypothetical protein [Effusibacillus pohliae]|nr:hypothetical protein [Effusibacillus pohliae]
MGQRRKMRARDKAVLLLCLLFGLGGAGYMLYLQYLYKTGQL